MRFSNRPFAVLMFAAAFAAATCPNPASADHSWGGYHWARTSNPFTVKLGSNVSSAWGSILSTTSSDWSASDVLNTTIVTGGAKPRNCRPTAGRVEVCNSTYGSTGWLGVAQIWITDGTHITQGTVKLNDTYFNTPTYNSTAWRNLVSCQEVGHTFGLDHQDENFNNANLGTCMDYTNDPSTNQHPNKHDYDELDIIYSHVDDATTVGLRAAPSAMFQIDFDTPAQWGQRVSASENGLVEKYELDFGGGNKVLTFVIWAEGEDRGQDRDRPGTRTPDER
jgi:hypothetical protein